ncbi:hypothetical protein GCK72_005809 [Caenorhabditis remanei]|uniref:Uncharacterized protein n=1 Tax=Caenorhabditis remanei TaxID=31234 RepID=A0A6A5HGK1_CAERE|nr:hypothetical protein GCK72_005809 [Caenorhabditis remanei]KAF1765856.1 hypothetical protein GCK72_005809 [Caenorhabditis remanei]
MPEEIIVDYLRDYVEMKIARPNQFGESDDIVAKGEFKKILQIGLLTYATYQPGSVPGDWFDAIFQFS